jgi:hypothetical protein
MKQTWFLTMLAAAWGGSTLNPWAAEPPRMRPPLAARPLPRAVTPAAAPQNAPEQLGLARAIWIGVRTDGLPGDGTLASPFNGAGEGFDARMRELCVTNALTNLSVHLLPGAYDTRGHPHWFPRAGWRIQGAGMHLTTLRLVVGPVAPIAILSPIGLVQADNVEVSDLTADCNYSATNVNNASAVLLWGSGNAIRRVRALHAHGAFPQAENFTLAISINPDGRSEGNVIEDCEVSRFRGNYATAIAMGGGYETYNTNTLIGAIRRNRVFDLYDPATLSYMTAFGFSASEGVVEDNLAVRCGNGFYVDTGRHRNLTVRNNTFLAVKNWGIAFAGRRADNVVIENNFIELDADANSGAGIACTDFGGQGQFTNFRIRHNVIRPLNPRFSRGGGFSLALTRAESVLITGNRVDASLSSFIQDGGRAVFFDNTDFSGRPLWTVEGAGGNQVNFPLGETGTLLLNKGDAYVVAEAGAVPAANGTNLLRAYARAKAMRPHGEPLSPTNRATVFLFPGRYALSDGALVLDAPYVDLMGLGNARATRLESDGNVLVQTADDVALENLTLHCASPVAPTLGPQDKAAYFPADSLARTVIRHCTFSAAHHGWSMRLGVTFAGFYEHCAGGPRSWGGPGNFAGRAVNCQAGPFSFGAGGLFSGFATNCTAGPSSFGAGGVGFHGYAKNCTAGHESFGGSGTLVGCEITGAINGTVATTGRLTDCRIGPPPGNGPALVIGAGATLYNCTVLANPAGNAFSIEAASEVPATIGHCRLNHGMRNVANTLAQPFNVEDPNLD